ncbi:hypothetical protein ACQ4M4_06140 [Leptolyngbya sp. AN02str]|uniref:hypothetical protein n=1 Tax=Leptolyngbya sp. AN02str TaxID=3423363 RepID=UPI003D323485
MHACIHDGDTVEAVLRGRSPLRTRIPEFIQVGIIPDSPKQLLVAKAEKIFEPGQQQLVCIGQTLPNWSCPVTLSS